MKEGEELERGGGKPSSLTEINESSQNEASATPAHTPTQPPAKDLILSTSTENVKEAFPPLKGEENSSEKTILRNDKLSTDCADAATQSNESVPNAEEEEEENANSSKTNSTSLENKEKHSAPQSSEPAEKASLDDYTKYMTYESDGTAFYTDPKTNYRYKFCTQQNAWVPCDADKDGAARATADNPYENEHYKWCSQTQKWIPKVQPQQAAGSDGVSYDIDEDGQRIYRDKDGTIFFWDANKNAWFPKIDDDFMAHYQMNYGFIDNTSAAEEEAKRKAAEEQKLKELELHRMTEEAKAAEEAAMNSSANGGAAVKRKAQEPPKWFDLDPEHNTKVYVSNLPLDITMEEFAELMGKCGMIMRDPQTQKHKLKLYAEADGQLKGDGLCDYIKVESVALALNILDEYNLRGNKIRVQRAEFQMRGEYNPALKPKRKKKDKEKLQKMKEKLFDWRPEKMRGERSKNEKVVIIKNLFAPSIFEKEVQLILDYQNDLREECGKCGTVRKVVIYDRHPEGIAQINMADPEEADVVIQMMHGRYFGQRKLTAEHWDGKTKYKVVESEAEVQKRLSNWDQYLTTGEEEQNSKTMEGEAKMKLPGDENEDDDKEIDNNVTRCAENAAVV
uniref:17S U2 SnRNP complex component HTATSF1 n=2 Tax=Ceratitis capitata TaxID=7213 RepID=W8B1F8_CERCA